MRSIALTLLAVAASAHAFTGLPDLEARQASSLGGCTDTCTPVIRNRHACADGPSTSPACADMCSEESKAQVTACQTCVAGAGLTDSLVSYVGSAVDAVTAACAGAGGEAGASSAPSGADAESSAAPSSAASASASASASAIPASQTGSSSAAASGSSAAPSAASQSSAASAAPSAASSAPPTPSGSSGAIKAMPVFAGIVAMVLGALAF